MVVWFLCSAVQIMWTAIQRRGHARFNLGNCYHILNDLLVVWVAVIIYLRVPHKMGDGKTMSRIYLCSALCSVSVFYLFLLLPLFLYDWFYGPPKQRKWFLWLFSCLTNFYYIPKFSHTQTTSTYACKREASMPRFWCEGIKRIFSVLEIGVKHTGCFKRCNFPIRLFYQEVRAQFDLFLFFLLLIYAAW